MIIATSRWSGNGYGHITRGIADRQRALFFLNDSTNNVTVRLRRASADTLFFGAYSPVIIEGDSTRPDQFVFEGTFGADSARIVLVRNEPELTLHTRKFMWIQEQKDF